MNVIKTTNLTKYYGKNRGIDNLNLTVEQNDIFGFIGPNGAGKSTTIRTLLGLITATSGSAEVLGIKCGTSKTDILRRIGFMPSETAFYNGMRVNEVISLSAKLHKKDCSKEAKILCERLQLDTAKKVDELSLGNRKKVGIVCALQHCPELYILDEPTSGLDPLMQKEFFDILRERNADGATVFLSSHVLSEISRYCKNAAIIRDGSIIAAGTVEELSKTAAKRVTVQGIETFEKIAGVKNINNTEKGVSFLYSGDISLLISKLNGLPVTDLTITEPDLDEIFMHYYTEGGESK